MRIERLEIDGFGRFRDASWSFDEGLTVLLGANEAGKSTLLNALRALLFGFESSRDGRAWYPALAGGRRGGRLVLRTQAGERWTVERHGERGGSGSLAVRAPNGNQGGQETLDRLLHGADRDLFTNIFAFGLGELQTFASLSADGVRGRIYGAGAGLGGTSAVDLERRLRQQMEASFLPRGRERPLNQLLARIEELRREIADLAKQPQEHADAHHERDGLRTRSGELREAVRAEREREARLARLLDARAPAAEAGLLGEELAAGDATLDRVPVDALAVLERHVAAFDEARRALDEVDLELRTARADRERLTVDVAPLENAEVIVAVRDERAARTGADDRRRELTAALARHAHAVDEQVARSGLGDEERLLALDDSIVAVERTRELERAVASAREASAEAERRARRLDDELKVRAGDGGPGAEAEENLEARIAALDELDALRVRRAAAEGHRAPPALRRLVAGVALAVAVGSLLAGVSVIEPIMGIVGAAIGLGVAVAILRTGGRDDLPALDAERRRLLDRAGLPPDAGDAEVRRLGAEIAVRRARADLVADGRAQLEATRRELAASQEWLAAARRAVIDAEEAWGGWLRAAALPDGASPEVARQVLAAAGVARRAAIERDEHHRRLEALDAEDGAYAARVADLARRLGVAPPPDRAARDAFVVGVVERLDAAREAQRRADDLEAAIERLTARCAALATVVEEREGALATFLATLGCPDAATLRRRAAEAAARREAASRVRELRERLAGMAGDARAVDALTAEARAADPAELEVARAEARERIARLDDEEREILNRIGALDARIARLEAAEELGARRQELAVLEGRAAALAREWAVRAVALRLLAETRSRYERERQPDVVRAATDHFERITDGRYARIVAPPGEGDVRVETEGGEARGPDQLSRGTAEQLYLALRFGLIEEFARSAEPLPVVMDDILVNFDVERAARAAAGIRDLADRHQVLYFTCHGHVAELLDPAGGRTLTLD